MKTTPWFSLFLFVPCFLSIAQTIDSSTTSKPAVEGLGWTERKTVAVILSTLIPGSGQTFLGHTEKGAAFTLSAFGSVLITVMSENDVVGRNERLDELNAAYGKYEPAGGGGQAFKPIASSFTTADLLWRQMVETRELAESDARRRNLFRTIAVAVWVANLVDILLFTDDLGEKTFGSAGEPSTRVALVPDRHNGVNAVVSVRF
jgi:hypothetical protein